MHGDAVFREITVRGGDLAFRADATPAADAIQIDAKLARGGQDRRADGKSPAFAGGCENYQWVSLCHKSPAFPMVVLTCLSAGTTPLCVLWRYGCDVPFARACRTASACASAGNINSMASSCRLRSSAPPRWAKVENSGRRISPARKMVLTIGGRGGDCRWADCRARRDLVGGCRGVRRAAGDGHRHGHLQARHRGLC